MPQRHVQADRHDGSTVRQGQASKDLADVAYFGGRRLEEFPPHRRVVEQMAHLDARARRPIPRPGGTQVAALAGDLRPDQLFLRTGLQLHLSYGSDRRQSLAAETEGGDAKQIIGAGELARGVAGESQRQIGRR